MTVIKIFKRLNYLFNVIEFHENNNERITGNVSQ